MMNSYWAPCDNARLPSYIESPGEAAYIRHTWTVEVPLPTSASSFGSTFHIRLQGYSDMQGLSYFPSHLNTFEFFILYGDQKYFRDYI
jgi:hypothetical protein